MAEHRVQTPQPAQSAARHGFGNTFIHEDGEIGIRVQAVYVRQVRGIDFGRFARGGIDRGRLRQMFRALLSGPVQGLRRLGRLHGSLLHRLLALRPAGQESFRIVSAP